MTQPGALIVPVSRQIAYAWACGWIGDCELLQSEPGREAVYFVTLPDLASFRRALPQFLRYYQSGARIVILRTNSPAVVHHVEKWGGYPTHQDPSGRWRYFVPSDRVERYFLRLKNKGGEVFFHHHG